MFRHDKSSARSHLGFGPIAMASVAKSLLVLMVLSQAFPGEAMPSGASQDLGYAIWEAVKPAVRDALGWQDRTAARNAVHRHDRSKHFVEFFCGTGGLFVAALSQELRCSFYDLVVDEGHDLLSAKGFALAISMALSIAVGGCAWFGVPCRTFVWMSRGHTKRTLKRPHGDCGRADVRQANEIVERVCILLQILCARQVYFIIEQPSGSLLWKMPKMRLAAKMHIVSPSIARWLTAKTAPRKQKKVRWARRFVWLGHYGHQIAKPTELCGIFPGLSTAFPSKKPTRRSNPKGMYYKTWLDKCTGRRRTCGMKALKNTEHYPDKFCHAVAALLSKIK